MKKKDFGLKCMNMWELLISLKSKYKIYFFYTVEFMLIAAAILHCFGNFSLIYGGDGYSQLYMTMVYCGKYLRSVLANILHGNFAVPQFDFSIGLGENIFSALNYYGFGDPFMLISAVVPVRYSTYAYTAIILLKMYMSGISYVFYCRNRKCEDGGVLAGAAVYTASVYVLYFGFQLPSYLNVMISIPLLCAGIDRVIDERKEKKRQKFWNVNMCIVAAVAFQAVSGFYLLYMELLFAAVYALVGLLCKIKDMKRCVFKIINLFGQVLLGMALGAVVFIPSVCGFLLCSRGGNFEWPGVRELLGVGAEGYWSVFSQILVPVKYSGMGLVLPAVAVFAVIMAIRKAERMKEIKIVFFILLAAYLNTHIVSWVAGGFSKAIYNNRWMASLMFIIAFLVSAGGDRLSRISGKKWISFACAGTAYIALVCGVENVFFKDARSTKRLVIYAVYLICTVLIPTVMFLIDGRKWKKRFWKTSYLLTGSIFIGVLLNIYTIFGGGAEGYGYGQRWYFKTYENAKGDVQASKTQLYSVENGFGRMDIEGNVLNESLYIGHYGTSEYLSILNSDLYEFYKNYGLVSEMKGTHHHLTGVESRNSMEDLLSVVWYEDKQADRVIENEDRLPLGFTFDAYIYREDAEEMDVMTKNASILEKVILDKEIEGLEKSAPVLSNDKILSEEPFEIEYVNIEREKGILKVTEKSKLVLTINGSSEGEYYLYGDRFQLVKGRADWYWVPVYFEGRGCEFVTEKNPYSNGIQMGLFCLGTMQSGRNTFEIAFTEEAEFVLENLHVYRIDTDEMKKLNTARSKETLQNVTIESNEVKGTVQIEGKKILFLGIPYSIGWKAYVNDEKTEILKADYGFMALVLEDGENEVCLRYRAPGFAAGLFMTLAAILILIFLGVRKRRIRMEEI